MAKSPCRVGDQTSGHASFTPTVIAASVAPTVIIEGSAVATVDAPTAGCVSPSPGAHPSKVVAGSGTVTAGGKPVARIGDALDCGAKMVSGASTVAVGD